MEKNLLIETLIKEGKITFAEGLVLANTNETSTTPYLPNTVFPYCIPVYTPSYIPTVYPVIC